MRQHVIFALMRIFMWWETRYCSTRWTAGSHRHWVLVGWMTVERRIEVHPSGDE